MQIFKTKQQTGIFAMSQFTKQKQKKPAKKEYLTDLRIRGATPEQVATSLFRNDKKLAEKKKKA